MLPTVPQLDDFHAQRGNSDWLDADAPEKSPAIYKASDYITATYRVDGHEADPRVVNAIMLLAPDMLGSNLRVRASDQALLSTEDGVGDGAYLEKRTYSKPTDDPYPLITALLADFGKRMTGTSGHSLKVIRVSRG